jgi:hypothetical protein
MYSKLVSGGLALTSFVICAFLTWEAQLDGLVISGTAFGASVFYG